ncbi:LysR family transcriptional regulator [Paenibacillus sp. UNC499MF]|uniref:LysR family transcriptional regulator n=1 Tax=Paenibacillus sp. UNC499MF TaxID=1502751 RepID=UPI000CDE78FA|nr:LysR family transcriptional regulator [Paenibacillus sp. UNC499MF]
MDLKQLHYFKAIAEEGQITAAAKRLHIAQPPLSQQLKAMEETLGAPLFRREGRKMLLTEEGRTLYKHAVKIIASMEEAQEEIHAVRSGWSGRLYIGVNTLSDDLLPRILGEFRQNHPQFTFKIHQNESSLLCRLLKDQAIDLAIVRMPLPLPLQDFTVHYLRSEHYFFVTAAGDTEAQSPITFERIREYPLIIPSTEGLGLHHMIHEEFAKRRLTPDIVCECSDMSTLLQLVSSGLGAGIVPETVLKLHPGPLLRYIPIEGDILPAQSALVGLKDGWLSRASQAFIDAYRNW